MKNKYYGAAALFLMVGFLVNNSVVLAARADLQKGKQESGAKGFIVETSHDEIVDRARKEGKLHTLSQVDKAVDSAMIKAFKKRYPFIDVSTVMLQSSDEHQRFLLELKAGGAPDFDVLGVPPDFYHEYIPHVKRFDILGMAQRKVLAIPLAMVDPKNRFAIALTSSAHVIAYNRKLIPEEKLPKSWEDFLKPEFKGRKFQVDIRPIGFAALAAGLGEKWAIDYARKIAAQNPIWVRGQSRALSSIMGGESTILHLAYHYSTVRNAKKDPTGSLTYKVIEPVPVRIQNFQVVNNASRHPYASLLWMEFLSSPEAQNIIDVYEEFNASLYSPGSQLAKMLQGKKLSVNNWETIANSAKWERMVFEAFGFPTAGK